MYALIKQIPIGKRALFKTSFVNREVQHFKYSFRLTSFPFQGCFQVPKLHHNLHGTRSRIRRIPRAVRWKRPGIRLHPHTNGWWDVQATKIRLPDVDRPICRRTTACQNVYGQSAHTWGAKRKYYITFDGWIIKLNKTHHDCLLYFELLLLFFAACRWLTE